jgi:large subunit ribosomal protein L15
MPLVRRVPKRGFHNPFALKVAIVNVGDLETHCQAGDEVTPESLSQTALLGHRYDEIKVLGDGELNKRLKVSAHRFSQSAVAKIEQAGGQVVRLSGRTPVEEKKKRARLGKRAQSAS